MRGLTSRRACSLALSAALLLCAILVSGTRSAAATENDKIHRPMSASSFARGAEIKQVSFECDVTPSKRCDLNTFVQYARVCALLVVQKGHLLLEYFNRDDGFCPERGAINEPTRRYGIASVTKAITSTLIGHAIATRYGARTRDDFRRILKMPVGRFVERMDVPPPSAYANVPLQDVLRMRSGVRWNELGWHGLFSDANQFSLDVRNLKMNVRDFARRYRARNEDGDESFNYSALDAAVVALVAERMVAPSSLTDFLAKGIWSAIGAQGDASWGVDADGTAIGPCCFKAEAGDLARFGVFVLNKGRVGRSQIVPEAWFEIATRTNTVDDDSIDPENRYQNIACPLEYRYFWWRRRGHSDFAAIGRDGQFVHVYPDSATVVVQISDWRAWINGSARECLTFRAHDALVRAAVKAHEVPHTASTSPN
ncbi:class C beta-lactamase-related serine hydrolase [Ensifer adhaerens]|nr:class C beta-lactamase-related serine hydrolase [Ensifer adhaerens]